MVQKQNNINTHSDMKRRLLATICLLSGHGGHGRHSYRHGTSRHAGQRGRTQTICLPQR